MKKILIKKNTKKINWAVLVAILLFAIYERMGYGCPILFLFGISCTGCGMTRAVIALLQMNLSLAFYFHPLVFIMPECIILWLFREKLPNKIFFICVYVVCVLFLIVYIARLLDSSNTVVIFDPKSGLIGKMLSALFVTKKRELTVPWLMKIG